MLDYIIVGLGLSGLAVSEALEKRNKTFVVFEDNSQRSSYVAGGIFNPVILKRFTPAWNAAKQMQNALPFYKNLEHKLEKSFVNDWNIFRRFHSIEEKNDWFVALDKPGLTPFMDAKIVKNVNKNISAEFGFGRVLKTGNIATEELLDSYLNYLNEKDIFKKKKFEYGDLKINQDHFEYENFRAKNIIFCEGFGLKKNPFFDYLPLRGNKGEYITILSEELQLDFAVKSSIFVMPLGNNLYKAGATYDHQDKSQEITSAAREKLVKELKKLIKCDFEVVDQVAGIRPAVSDRKPLVGPHPEIPNMYCCNGFGSRGVLIAPNMAEALLNHIENRELLDPEIDLGRFTKKHFKSV